MALAGPRWTSVALVALGALLLVLDLATKQLAADLDHLRFVDPVRNSELMLGVGGSAGPLAYVMSAGFIVGGVVVAIGLIRRGWLWSPILAFGVAGFLGNLIDRVALGEVRDWAVVGPTRWNAADVYLLVAIVATVLAGIRSVNTVNGASSPTRITTTDRR